MARGQGDNGEGRFSLELSLDDLPMMVDLLTYGVTRAWLSGQEGRGSSERFARLREQLQAMSPIPKRFTGTGYTWADACAAARSADEVWLSTVAKRSFREGVEAIDILVNVDGQSFKIAEEVESTDEADGIVRRVEDLMEPLVPMAGRMLFRFDGVVEVDGPHPYGDEDKVAAIRATLVAAFGEDASEIKVSEPSWEGRGENGGLRLGARFHVPSARMDSFRMFIEGDGVEPASPRMR